MIGVFNDHHGDRRRERRGSQEASSVFGSTTDVLAGETIEVGEPQEAPDGRESLLAGVFCVRGAAAPMGGPFVDRGRPSIFPNHHRSLRDVP